MKVTSRFAGLIIATGDKTNHMQTKPFSKTGSIPVLQRMVDTLYSAGAYPVVMITGQEAWEVERYLSGSGVIFIRAEDYKELTTLQMIQGGCAYLADKHKLIVVTTVEFPYFQAETIKQLISVKCIGGISVYKENQGLPVVLGAELIRTIAETETEDSVIEYLKKQPDIAEIETEDEGIFSRVEASGKLPESVKQGGGRMLHPYMKMNIGSEEQIIDSRVKMLLFLLDETGSVKTASAHTALPLMAAWEMIGFLEQALGYPVVERYQDRFYGKMDEDRASLTDKGRDFLTKYVKYERQLTRYAIRTFEELFYEKETE